MDNRILKVKEILSFKPDRNASDYTLIQVDSTLKHKFIKLINKLEQIPQVYLCVRGDSKKNDEYHNSFFNNDLSKLFIVGQKSRSNIETPSNPAYIHYDNNSPSLIKDIEKLVKETNIEISNKSSHHNISGTIPQSFVVNLKNLDLDQLQKWKIFFLSFLHNNGKNKSFKNYSPFISLTYGHNKYITARKFSLNRSPHKKGIIFLYSLNAGWPYYIRTIDFSNELKKFGIIWYKDIHNEIMLIDGMYPHFLIGIFEVEAFKNPRFIINPWLYDSLLKNQHFDYSKGLKIDQTYFSSFAKKLGYSNFFFHLVNDSEEYVSELNQINFKKVYHP